MSVLYRKLSPSGDYTFGHGMSDFYKDADAVGQAIRTRLLLLYGEWWEDQEDGTPLFEEILRKSMTDSGLKAVDLIVKDRILGVDGVAAIKQYKSEVNRRSRTYSIEAVIETIYGEVNINLDFGGR